MACNLSVSVIICAYTEDRWGDLVAAVESVQHQTLPPQELILVVDHNPTLFEQARRDLPGVMVVENHKGRGLSGARNSGIAFAQGAIFAFLDDDAIAAPDWIEQLCSAYTDSSVLGVGGKIEPVWQNGRPVWFPVEFDWVVGCSYRGLPELPSPVRNLIGANMSFRREVFEAIGIFELDYGCDETHFCIRVRQEWPDKKMLYLPAARVFHRVPLRRATWEYFRERCYFEGGSKAVVSWLLGMEDGLSSEWAYVFRTLPQGVIHGVMETLVKRNQFGLARAGAIAAGLAITVSGYLMGKLFIQETAQRRGWNPA